MSLITVEGFSRMPAMAFVQHTNAILGVPTKSLGVMVGVLLNG